MNIKNTILAFSAALGLAASAGAEDRAPQLPPIDAGTIWNQINNNHNPFPQPNQTTAASPRFEDYEGCSAVDNMFIMQPMLKDALDMLAPCMKSLSAAHGVPLKAAADGAKAIKITVGDSDKAFNLVDTAVAKRRGQFFGYPVTIERK